MKKVSETLKEEREKKGFTLLEIAKATKIKKGFLEAIEEGRLNDLPSESYALGFIKNYAEYLLLSPDKITALFRREYKREHQEILPGFRQDNKKFPQKNFLSSKSLLIILSLLVFFVYMFYQFSPLFFSPYLAISRPKNGEEFSDSVISVLGKTDPYAMLVIDGDEVTIGLDGSFKKSLFAFPGEKKISVVVKNRFGRETRQIITVKVK